MGISIAVQTQIFLMSLMLGVVFGIVYDIFRAFRAIFSLPSPFVFIEDLLYGILCGCICFTFMLLTNSGTVRFYIFAGAGIGFIIYICTLGAFFIKRFREAVNTIKSACRRFFYTVGAYFSKLLAKLYKKTEKLRKTVKNIIIFLKKPFLFLIKWCKIYHDKLYVKKANKKPVKHPVKEPVKSSGRTF